MTRWLLLLGMALAPLPVACRGRARVPDPTDSVDTLPESPKHLTIRTDKPSGGAEPSPLLGALGEELDRNFALLAKEKPAPYFLAYEAIDEDVLELAATVGALAHSARNRVRSLDVDVRVGSEALDNTHSIRGDGDVSREFTRSEWLPVEDDPFAIKSVAWLATRAEYDRALSEYIRVQADQNIKVKVDGSSADFSKEPPRSFLQRPAVLRIDASAWEARVRKWSEPFLKDPEILESGVAFAASSETRAVVTSDGSKVQTARTVARVEMTATTVAADGMRLERTETLDAPSADALPSDASVTSLAERMMGDLRALRAAPVVEPYVGPAILDGRAAAVFFHEIFGHRIEGHRQKNEDEGQTFSHKIGEAIMPAFLDVFDDPTAAAIDGIPLSGHYAFDDEGIPTERTSLVQRGVLRGFLLSRSPVAGFDHSNGHGRRERGRRIVARQGNLVVDPLRTTTPEALKQRLIEEVRQGGRPYGLRFHEITGGYTNTTREASQAFKVLPVMVYRVYPDGREELVRGADLEGTPLSALSRIVAAANDFQVFNGVCGAESGWVPVSAVSPSLLIGQIEVARREKSQERPPLLPAPRLTAEKGSRR